MLKLLSAVCLVKECHGLQISCAFDCFIGFLCDGVDRWPCLQSSTCDVSQRRSVGHTIVIAANSSPPQHYAAQELQTLLEQISGATLPVADQPTESPMILVGPSDGVNRLLPEIEYETLGEEGLIMKTVGPHLVLTGGPLRGTLYAVYEFLDRQLGCRWFTGAGMTPAVTRIPQKRTIVIDSLDVRKVPALEYRSARHRELSDGDWAARNRFNGHSSGVTEKHGGKINYYRSPAWHTFRYFFGPSHFESHPEYFAQVDGQRQMSQLCTSHPDVIVRGSNLLRHWLRQDPKARFVSLIANDSGGFCSCELCGPLTEYARSRAAPVLHLANQIADNLKEDFPHAIVDTLAYSPTCPPPRFARPRDNVMVRFATPQACRAHPLDVDCGDSWHLAKFLRSWGKKCPQMYVWDYVVNFTNFLQPFPNFHTMQPNIQFYLQHNVRGIMNQSSGILGEFTQMRAYLTARLMWDANCDFEAEMADFLQAYYGPGGKPIGQYIEMMRQKVAAGPVPLKPLPTDVLCPSSGKPMFMRDGEFYPFLACENHPNCQSELEVDGASAEVVLPRRPPMKTDLACPDCDRPLELRRSHSFGPWTLCPNFPDCLGRLGWSTIQRSKRVELDAALVEHEKSYPQLKVCTRDGKEYEADGQPLRVPGRQEGGKPWIRVHMFDSMESPYLSKEIIHRAGELFDQAEAAVADDPVLLKRVRKERLGIEVVRISRPEEFLPTWQAYDQAVESFAQIAGEWNFENIREGGSFNRQLKQWKARAKRLKEAANAADR